MAVDTKHKKSAESLPVRHRRYEAFEGGRPGMWLHRRSPQTVYHLVVSDGWFSFAATNSQVLTVLFWVMLSAHTVVISQKYLQSGDCQTLLQYQTQFGIIDAYRQMTDAVCSLKPV